MSIPRAKRLNICNTVKKEVNMHLVGTVVLQFTRLKQTAFKL